MEQNVSNKKFLIIDRESEKLCMGELLEGFDWFNCQMGEKLFYGKCVTTDNLVDYEVE